MNFKKLEITGFKSFPSKTTVLIEEGLTGIVGPNGCGKSNIVESLRWCMGETSAKSIRGSEMEDIIFSGTANSPSKNIAEVTITIDNSDKDGPIQFKEIDTINIKRRIEKNKGSKYYINEREVRARDAQTFFADLSTGAHSPSIISQGRIGALVTAKPSDRRSILEEAAGISGIHTRRHEAELRLDSAENNLKKADELKRQLEKDIKSTNEIINESDDEVSGITIELNHNNNLLKDENSKLKPLRDKNLEILSKLQKINLDLKNLEEQEIRIKEEKDKIINSKQVLDSDLEREKNIILDATSNEKRILEEKSNLIDFERKYFEIEKEVNLNLDLAINKLDDDQNKLKKIHTEILNLSNSKKDPSFLISIKDKIIIIENYLENREIDKVSVEIKEIKELVNSKISTIEIEGNDSYVTDINNLTEKIKKSQENYANALSKNQSVKIDAAKRQERIKNIDSEIKNWKNLKSNSEKMSTELNNRKEVIKKELDKLDKIPANIAIKKGQTIQNLSNTNDEKENLSKDLSKAEKKYNEINEILKHTQEKMMVSRERRARSIATLEGLKNRKKDLLERINDDLKIGENDLLNFSDLKNLDVLPDTLEQEEKLDSKKRNREALGSVNLRADEDTSQFELSIKKMEEDRKDLVEAILKLRNFIKEINQKGREKLLDAFEKVNKKFNEVYIKLFNGGNAKLELVDSEDPLEAGLEMLVSPPGKRLQSITLLSGGEQALTALSLVFAVFLTSPSPICILDEVDAPLDDANVSRFCVLLNELIKITKTKFIIVSHHALTMSKMNRLYGVTMPNKGISQLVTVNLEKAEELVA